MKKHFFFLVFALAALTLQASAYDFQSGNLLYSIISANPPCVSLEGHVDGENAQGELVIPETLTHEGVTYTVTEIAEWAFKNCTGLTGQLTIPSTLDTIHEGAFYGCSGFTGTLAVPNTVVLKNHAFRECSGFTGLVLPDNIREIPIGAFCGCSGLTGALVFPETVEIIGDGAFTRCSGFTGVVFPYGLKEIREQAFAGCTGFTGSLVFPETVTHIKYGAFHDCSGFSGDLVIPNAVVQVGHTLNNAYYVVPQPSFYTPTFADCFDHLVLSQSLDTIGMYCFAGCSRLTGDLVMPSGLKAIMDNAFERCSGFTSLTLDESLSFIGVWAFMDCKGITGTLAIPENICVGHGAFEMCEGIRELTLPRNITFTEGTYTRGSVFYGCSGLTELDIPEGWTRIEALNFASCSNLRRVHLPQSLTSIEGGAFSDCTSLEEINIPEGVTSMGDVFWNCSSLTHIELPSTLRALGAAFCNCIGLAGEVIIPDLVQRINMNTFKSCSKLDRIVFGDSVNWIAEPAFEHTELSSLVLKAVTPPQLVRKATPNAWHLPDGILIIVPCGTLEAYQNAEGWSEFTNIQEGVTDLLTVVSSDENAGTVAVLKEATCEDRSVTVEALPNEGCAFLYWEVGGEQVSTDNPYTFELGEDTGVVARFSGAGVDETCQLFSIYPNPAKDKLYTQFSPDVQPVQVELYDLQGRPVRTQRSAFETIDLSRLPAGTYTMRVVMKDGKTYSDKVVKE